MRVAVVGAGAIGSLFGARLSSSGHEVVLVGRPDHVRAVRERGLRVTGAWEGTFRLRAEEAAPSDFRADAILWTVKAGSLSSSASVLARSAPTPVPTLLPQNGLGVEATAARALRRDGWSEPERVLVRAVNNVPSTLVGPGEVRAAGEGELVLPAPVGPNAGAVRLLTELLSSSGLRLRTVPDLGREEWRKAVINAAINPVTALHHVPNGRLLDEPYRTEALRLLAEARDAAEWAGYGFPDAEVRAEFDRVVRATASNRSSMLQDVERGRPTEVDAISGELLRAAQRTGHNLPATREVVERLSRPHPAEDRESRGQPS